ncbi:MAG: translocation/assembly module TamB domain-containing protein [Deltaproteobacteria bacterium]|nr:translocation/assembly module TamB domain-containing protein [Deltaproteobacteria bacterium]
MTTVRRVAAVLGYAVAVMTASVVMALVHLDSEVARRAITETVNRVLSRQFVGRLHIEAITRLSLRKGLDATGISLDDARGRRIGEGATLHADSLLDAVRAVLGLRSATMPALSLNVQRLRLIFDADAKNSPSIAGAFDSPVQTPRQPRSVSAAVARAPTPLRFPRMQLQIGRLEIEHASVPASATSVSVQTAMVTEPFSLRSDLQRASVDAGRYGRAAAHGVLTLGFPAWQAAPPPSEDFSGNMHATVRLDGPELQCDASMDLDSRGLRVDLRDCLVRRELIARLTEMPIATDVRLQRVQLGQLAGQTTLHAETLVGDRTVGVDITASDRAQEAVIVLGDIDLSRVEASLPATVLGGVVRLRRNGTHLALDGAALRATVAGVEIPPFQAEAELRGRWLDLTSVTAPALGLHAHGRVDLEGPHHDATLTLDADVTEASGVALLRAQGIAGALRVHAELNRHDAINDLSYRVVAQNLVAPGAIRAENVQLEGTARAGERGSLTVAATARVRGLRASGVGPLTGSVAIHGDPRTALDGRFTADASALAGGRSVGVTRASGSLSIRRNATQMDIRVSAPEVRLRGAPARLTASVTIPTRGVVSVRAELVGADQSRLRLSVRGREVSVDAGAISVPWLAQMIGLTEDPGGTVEGSFSLVGGHPRGSLRWQGGTLPRLGAASLSVTAGLHPRGMDRVQAELSLGAAGATQTRVVVDSRLQAMRATGGLDQALASLQELDVSLEHLHANTLTESLPPGLEMSGEAAARLRAFRLRPGNPLSVSLGFDLRSAVLSANLNAAIMRLIGSPRRNRGGAERTGGRPLTVPLRLRGALCAEVPHAHAVPQHTLANVRWGHDRHGPVIAVPESCARSESEFDGALIGVDGETRGPWNSALLSVISQVKAFRQSRRSWRDFALTPATEQQVANAAVQLHVVAGPLAQADWPLTRMAARFFPMLARPSFDGSLNVELNVDGPLRGPNTQLRLRAVADAPEWLSRDDSAELDATVRLAPVRQDASILDRAELDLDLRASLRRAVPGGGEPPRAQVEMRSKISPRALLDGRIGLRSLDFDRLSVRSTSLDLSRFAWARAHRMDGRASITLADTGDAASPFILNLAVNDVRVRSQQQSNIAVRAGLYDLCRLTGSRRPNDCRGSQWALRSCATWAPDSQGVASCDPNQTGEYSPEQGMRLLVAAPLIGDWHEGVLDRDGVDVVLNMLSFPIERIAPFIETPPIVHVGGAMTSTLRWRSRDPRALAGFLRWMNGEVTIEKLGVPIRDIDLSIMAQSRRLMFSPEMHATLGVGAAQGTLTASGLIDLNGRRGELARLRILPRITNFPAIQEGNLYAVITGALDLETFLYSDHLDGSLTIQQANIQIPEDSSRSLQSLDDAGGIFVMGRSRLYAPSNRRGFATNLTFRTQEPIFLRRRDFLIGVTTEGAIRYDNGLYLSGSVAQSGRQNYFELFGKRFYFDRVSVLFDGSTSIDPVLDVALHYDSPTDGRISILVGGRKSAPDIRFTAERFPGASEAEILAMLVLGRRESRGASDQATLESQGRQAAASLLTALLYGFGAGQVQRAIEGTGLGFVPTFIAEPGADGSALARLGVGVLPSFLGNRVYIEGTYNNSQATGQGGQLLIDATINDHFSIGGVLGTSSNNGQRFGVDFFFSP